MKGGVMGKDMAESVQRIILFDGVCNLCNGVVRFIIDHDPAGCFRFASIQSETGRTLMASRGLTPGDLSTFVLLDGSETLVRSDAALRIAGRLSRPWPVLAVLRIVPRPLRDWMYGLIGRNRYRLFGRSDQCRVPTPAEVARFLA